MSRRRPWVQKQIMLLLNNYSRFMSVAEPGKIALPGIEIYFNQLFIAYSNESRAAQKI
jgi:hypothetical protein